MVFDDDKCLLYDKKSMQLIYSVKMAEDKMFPLVFSKVPINAFTSSSDDSLLWHQRFGHLNFRGLTLLSKRNMVNGLPTIRGERQTCEACIFGKHHREKFPKGSSWRAEKPLMLVHADVYEPMQTLSLSGSKYLIFIDDFSRMTWVYFLKEKSEVFDNFRQFKAMVKKQKGCPILTLRTDRDGEFTSTKFNNFCSDNGIQRQFIASYTPQQNGVAERKNRTIVKAARSMLKNKIFQRNFGLKL